MNTTTLLTNFFLYISLFFSLNFQLLHHVSANSNQTDRLALLEIRKGITNDPRGVFDSWNDSLHFCNWQGVQCTPGNDQRVTSLSLPDLSLGGTLSPHIGNLSFLSFINLENNTFRGQIPPHIGNLFRLQHFNASQNTFQGQIPANLSRCSQLRILKLGSNELVGGIPDEIGSLSKLEILRIGTNNLTGTLPDSIGNLSQLVNLGAAYNNLVGRIPESFGQLSKLNLIAIGVNQLTGTIPPSLYNVSSISIMTFAMNKLEGTLPENLGLTLTNLAYFGVSGNNLSGTIPRSFCNASQLVDMNMNRNQFVGRIPNCLGNYGGLLWVDIAVNNLGYNSTGDFDFLTSLTNCTGLERLGIDLNNFGGPLPDSIGNLSSTKFKELFIASNQITLLPKSLVNLNELVNVDLSFNFLRGAIPSYFGKFQNLQGLNLQGNKFSAEIPESIGNLSQLLKLDLSFNRLEGQIPASLGKCIRLSSIDISSNRLSGAIYPEIMNMSSSLVTLFNMSHNLLSGNLPPEIGKFTNLNAMDLSYNNLTRGIPNTIANCEKLEHLYMQGNSFDGIIPPSLASMKALQELDLSKNKLSGEIPQQLQNARFFQYLNLSYNNLSGQVPSRGVFANSSAVSLMGNAQLCGGAVELHLPACSIPQPATNSRLSRRVKLSIILVSVLILLALLVASVLYYTHRRLTQTVTISEDEIPEQFLRVSYRDLDEATDGFSPNNLVGSGGFGTVYKGNLTQIQTPVAVKVLDLQRNLANKSLAAECNALRNVRHRNLVKVLSFCSSLDHKGNEFKALIFEYMENGSLENWLHQPSSTRNLSLVQRLKIIMDVASALHYLHDLCDTRIVHCDLKPSNVLLDGEMVAHVSDFGQARLLLTNDGDESDDLIPQSSSTTVGVKGTVGYAAPEYGMGSAVSEQGDVYSFGIVVLEMLTLRRPTDEMFRDGLNLHGFVKAALMGEVGMVIDPVLVLEEEGDDKEWDGRMSTEMERCLGSVLEIGVACSAESPAERMRMADVNKKLEFIRDQLL
ncbi:Probable LRR receptor-like serine/threonine-protein kinase At3g47570 [Linum perenne]